MKAIVDGAVIADAPASDLIPIEGNFYFPPSRQAASLDRSITPGRRDQPPQPQPPPQQPPPEAGTDVERPRPPRATADSSLTVSSWPCGQTAGADDSIMGRVCSKVSPQARHRYSYRGTVRSLSGQSLMGDGSATSTAGTESGSV
jgi:hypothetical protein